MDDDLSSGVVEERLDAIRADYQGQLELAREQRRSAAGAAASRMTAAKAEALASLHKSSGSVWSEEVSTSPRRQSAAPLLPLAAGSPSATPLLPLQDGCSELFQMLPAGASRPGTTSRCISSTVESGPASGALLQDIQRHLSAPGASVQPLTGADDIPDDVLQQIQRHLSGASAEESPLPPPRCGTAGGEVSARCGRGGQGGSGKAAAAGKAANGGQGNANRPGKADTCAAGKAARADSCSTAGGKKKSAPAAVDGARQLSCAEKKERRQDANGRQGRATARRPGLIEGRPLHPRLPSRRG